MAPTARCQPFVWVLLWRVGRGLVSPGTVLVGAVAAGEHRPLPGMCRWQGRSSRGPLSSHRFGDGYMITVRTKSSLNVKEVVRFFNRNFPEAVLKVSSLRWQCHPLPAPASGCKQPSSAKGHVCGTPHRLTGGSLGVRAWVSSLCPLQERHHTKAQYQLKSDQISLAQVFSKMEQVVDVLGIEDYSVSQTTLDNVRLGTAQAAGCLSSGRAAVARGGWPCQSVWQKPLLGREVELGGDTAVATAQWDALGPIFSSTDGRRGAAGGGWRCLRWSLAASCPFPRQVFVNFAKKQSDNLEQQETSPSCTLQSPLERVLSLLRPRAAPTELRALVVEEQEDLETDDEGLISFEEERVRGCPQIWVSLVPAVSLPWGTGAGCHGTGSYPGKGTQWGQGWTREGSLGGVAAPHPRPDPGPRSTGCAGQSRQPLPSS